MNTDKFWGYIGGIIDGEGSVTSPLIRPSGAIIITNTNQKMLKTIRDFLTKHKINTHLVQEKKKQKSHHSTCYRLQIYGWRNLRPVLENCPLLIKEKYNRLEFIVRRGELKEKLKQDRIKKFMALKKEYPEYSLRKISKILDENLSNMLYRWGVKELLEKKISFD